ncbi:MAG: hypothetical protein WDZ56_00765 [Candidatus Paceibacterota bacterium]
MFYFKSVQDWQSSKESMAKIMMMLAVLMIVGLAAPVSAYESNYYYEARPAYGSNEGRSFSNSYFNQYDSPAYSRYQPTDGHVSYSHYSEPAEMNIYGGDQYYRQPQLRYDNYFPTTHRWYNYYVPTYSLWVEKWSYEQTTNRGCSGLMAYSGGIYLCRVQ